MRDYSIIDYGNGIVAIDSGYERPGLAAVHLLCEGDRAALIDTAANSGVPHIMAELAQRNIRPEQVDYIILTHIHLDHAGAAGTLMQLLPNARLLVHPRGARHMAAPGRLIDSATTVYGADEMRRKYGDIQAIDTTRIVEVRHEQRYALNGRELLILDTPGHARHHICIRDDRTGHIFAGDTFGLSYRELDHEGCCFVYPTTTPVQFEPEALHHSIDLLMSYQPAAIYLTHFGQVTDTPRLARNLHRLIDAQVRMALALKDAGADRHDQLKTGIETIVLAEATRDQWGLQGAPLLELLGMDIELNAQGLDCWLDGLR
jgi:glyoxylase-like metal-dependent hydrolase (beta-lactamase superfamily II)